MRNSSGITFILCLTFLTCSAQKIDQASIQKTIKVLADDSMQGRGTGAEGGKMAATFIEKEFKKLALKPYGDKKSYQQAFPFKGGVHGTGEPGTSNNIVGFLDNGAENTVIIGAHYDHLGLGKDGGSLDANPQDKIHNGADDNASGVAGVLELAKYFKNNSIKEKNNFLFICFSGEELGLIGSKFYTEHPTVDLTKVDFMINLDMVGRLDPKNGLSVSGSGTSPQWEPLLKKTKH